MSRRGDATLIPALQAISITTGDSREIFFRIKRKVSDNPATYEYLDLTGCTVRSQIRPNVDSDTVLATFTCTLANQSTSRGGVFMKLTPIQTRAITTNGVYDVEVEFPTTGELKTFVAGSVTITKDVTRT